MSNNLVYRYTEGYTKVTKFSVSGTSYSQKETNEIITLTNINGNVTVTDNLVALSYNGNIGDGLNWKVESIGNSAATAQLQILTLRTLVPNNLKLTLAVSKKFISYRASLISEQIFSQK